MIDQNAKNLGEALVKSGVLTEKEFNKAVERASKENAPTLIISLLELEYLTFKVFEKFVLSMMGIKSGIVSSHDLNPTLVARVGANLINTRLIFPISTREDKEKKLLALGMVDPTDEKTIKKVEDSTGWKVVPILISLPDFKEALKKNQKRIPGLSEIKLKPDVGPFELQLEDPSAVSTMTLKGSQIRLKEEDAIGSGGRKFREEVLAKLDLEPAEIPLLTEATCTRDTLTVQLQRVGLKTLQKIYDQASDEIKLEALVNLLIAKGLVNKHDMLIFSAVSLAFKGDKK